MAKKAAKKASRKTLRPPHAPESPSATKSSPAESPSKTSSSSSENSSESALPSWADREMPPPQLHLTICNSGGRLWVEEFPDLPTLHERLQELHGRECWVRIFHGQQLYVSQPPLRYLLVPGQEPLPLFPAPDVTTLAPDEEGYLGGLLAAEDEPQDEDPAVEESATDAPDTLPLQGEESDAVDSFYDQ